MKIAVFTAARSEYGLLKPVIKEIQSDHDLELILIVAGAHLSESFGMTVQEIVSDGFKISARIPFLENSDNPSALSRGVATLTSGLANTFSKEKPDLLIVLGDRYELLAVATVATLFSIPIAHISGGETTEGAIDNQIRHAMTKLSHLHFPALDEYAKRIVSMGEEAWRVLAVGEPGLDEICTLPYIEKHELLTGLKLDPTKKIAVATFHPETIHNKITAAFVESVLDLVSKFKNYQVVVTASGSDEGGRAINEKLEQLSARNTSVHYIQSLGKLRYYSLLKVANLMIGNSSSGIVESQSFFLPSINVGDRQKGRAYNDNVIHTRYDLKEIEGALITADSDAFRQKVAQQKNKYEAKDGAPKMIRFIKSIDTSKLLMKKAEF